MPLSPLKYGTVKGRFIAAVADTTNDIDDLPDAVPMTGKVTFKPDVQAILLGNGTQAPVTVMPAPITAVLDSEGYLTLNGQRGVKLIATDNVEANPTNFTWTVELDLRYQSTPVKYPGWAIEVPADRETDLTLQGRVPSASGTAIIRGASVTSITAANGVITFGLSDSTSHQVSIDGTLVSSIDGKSGAVDLTTVYADIGNVVNTIDGEKGAVDLSAKYSKVDDLVVNVKKFGAVGDGVTDDGPAIRAARSAATGRVLFFPPGTYRYVATGNLALAENSIIRGVAGATKILFESSVAGEHRVFVHNASHNTALEGIEVVRNADFPAVLFTVNGYNNVRVKDCKFDGRRDTFTSYCHGFQLGMNSGLTNNGLAVEGTTFTRMTFALFQTNGSTGITRNVTFRRCTFTANYATDLEFNSPMTDTFNVSVIDCRFIDNRTPNTGAGFAVGLAHVTRAVVKGNFFDGYANEAVHIEDYSQDIVVEGNSFVRCGTTRAAYIRLISGVSDVTIANNVIDATQNTVKVYIIQSTMGGDGTGLTPGGRVGKHPLRINIHGNVIKAGLCDGVYASSGENLVVANNTLIASGAVASLAFDNANSATAFDFNNGRNISITGNNVRGFLYATRRETTGASTGGDGLTIIGNSIEDCKYGISVINPGAGIIANNMIRNVVHPLVAGQGGGTSKPIAITGNHADGCKYPLEIAGKLMVVPTADAVVGATAISIEPLAMSIAASHIIRFPNGAVFTPASVGASAGATSITGTLTGAAVTSGTAGRITNLWHSWSGSANRVAIIGNIDSVDKIYGEQVIHSANGTRHWVTVTDTGALTTTTI